MGKRSRRRTSGNGSDRPDKLVAPTSKYTDKDHNEIMLRGVLTAATRHQYADALAGIGRRAATTQEDTWQRATELLFERLTVRWTIAGVPIESQRELLARYRAASVTERAWVRDVLREHCAEHFPDVQAP